MRKAIIIISVLAIAATACKNPVSANQPSHLKNSDSKQALETADTNIVSTTKTNSKMKVEIWSDVVCPFCYIGKTKFEKALEQFPHKDQVEIVWKSYQLMPDLITQANKNADQVLAESKGWSLEQAKQLNAQAAQMGKEAGLEYNFDKAIVANTFKAHQFIHFAKKQGKQNEAESILFRSYFTDGKNVDDINTLVSLGKEIGLETSTLEADLQNQTYSKDVNADIQEAAQVGVRGVPFFVVDRKYAVSGAQEPKAFLETLEKSFAEWLKENPQSKLEVKEGAVCKPDGKCD